MAVLTNTVTASDVAPAISINLTNELHDSIKKFAEIMGVNRMDSVPAGSTVTIYKSTAGTLASQVSEGDEIGLTDVSRAGTDYTMTLKKYRKLVTAEAIQKSGRDIAIYDTDKALLRAIRADIKSAFFTKVATGTGTATAGANLQAQMANNWASLETYFEDSDVEPVHFVNPATLASYLGSASITTQEAFGLTYIENFLGLGTVVVSSGVTAGVVLSTAKENLHCAYVPANGAVGQELELTSDETGLIGITHERNIARAGVETLMMSGVVFFPEELAGIIKGTISA